MKHSIVFATLLFLAAVCSISGAPEATTLLRLNVHDLSLDADLVVIGTVEEVATKQVSEKKTRTVVRFIDLEVVKGEFDGATLEIEQEGGLPGDGTYIVDGMPIMVLCFGDGAPASRAAGRRGRGEVRGRDRGQEG
ncbi:hypothetical protein ACFL2Z_04570 [Candidatus Eisenbacteria bacterium]|uniref:DUF5666 domain-containing protein n=1 Tax=Eiseniibacteriota bacterium TaxID=2212470 RepID=A0ABV6YQH7_UNCEI